MVDAPGTGGRVAKLWNIGPKLGVTRYGKQDDVVGIYLEEYYHTYVVACKEPLRRVEWHTLASWQKWQGLPSQFTNRPKTVIGLDGVWSREQLHDEFYKVHQGLAPEFLNP
jgi:hypothetical protein